ncbi:protein O-mannosyl-transferase family [Epilithonimonas sp. UC225_85]|uniref:protein O-mannosyl-transferase family n=1 Tax=Epilithonimonas sp. UC225_85 TaxID=3350167 RepID=UPI0036D43391
MTKKTITFLIFLSFFIIYYIGSFSKISFGDCIGFVLDVENRKFITNVTPLAHFLYINIPIFFTKFLNIDSVFAMRLMSVVPAALTVGFVYVLIKEFIQENWIAVASTVVFGFGFTFWRSAETVEVYTFNALWVILFLVYSIKSLKDNSKNYIILAGIFLGVSFWVHIQNIMLIPGYLVLLYLLRSDRKKVLISLVSFITIFSFMFFVNYLNGIEAKYVFTSKKGPWVQNTFEQSFLDLIKDVVKSVLYLIYNFNIFIIFCVSGIVYLYRNFKNEFFFIATASLFTLGFATFYAVSDNYVYFIPFYLLFIVFIALGIKKLSAKYALIKLKFAPLFIPLFYCFSLFLVSFTPQGKKFHQDKLYKGGLNYYMLPWLNNNIGCIEFTLDNGKSIDNVEALKEASNEFIQLRKKYQTLEEIRKL